MKTTTSQGRNYARDGENYRLQGEFDRALEEFDRAIALEPDDAWTLAHRGETYYLLKRYNEALADFQRAVERQPDYVWAIAHRGVTYRFLGEEYYEKAIADLERAIAAKPDYVWALAYCCRTYELMGQYKKALLYFDRAVAIDNSIFYPKHWRYERGLILCYDGQYEAAIAECEEHLKEFPDDTTALYCIAVSKARLQGLEAARAAIARAREALQYQWETGDRGDILYRLCGLEILEGNCRKAWDYLRESIPLNSEAIELVGCDPAWLEWRDNPQTKDIIARST